MYSKKKNEQERNTKTNSINKIALRIKNHFQKNEMKFAWYLLIPVLSFFLILNVIPTLWMIGLSFYKYSLISAAGPKFVGIKNFIDILSNNVIWNSFSKTFLFVLMGVGIQTILGILLGFLFWNSDRLPGRRFALTFLFTPMIIAPVAAGTYFKLIYDPTLGIGNYFIKSFFGLVVNFLGDASYAFFSVLLVDIWMWTPFMILMTLAALGSVPEAELEAAEVDNLPWLKRLRYVILPHSKFIIMLGILLRTIESFKTMDLIYTMTSGGPGNATELIAIKLFREAFASFNMGESAALALITLLSAIAFTSIYLFILQYKEKKV